MDTHQAMQIFHPIFMVNDQGHHPDPFSLISVDDIERGRWKPHPEVLHHLGIEPGYGERHLLHYTQDSQKKRQV